MGAPGNAVVCQKGHLFFWSDDDLFDSPLEEAHERALAMGCPCGEQRIVDLCHYGTITDCLGPEDGTITEIDTTTLMTSRNLKPIPDAVDRSGKPIRAFRKSTVTLKTYNVLKLNIPFRVHAARVSA